MRHAPRGSRSLRAVRPRRAREVAHRTVTRLATLLLALVLTGPTVQVSAAAPVQPSTSPAAPPSSSPASSPSAQPAANVAAWGRVPFSDGLRDPYGGAAMTAVAAGRQGIVAVGYSATGAAAWRSADGLQWQRVSGPSSWVGGTLLDVATTPTGVVAVGRTGKGGTVWESPDGLTWRRTASGLGIELRRVVEAEGRLHAIGPLPDLADGSPRSAVWSSDDGRTWSDDREVKDIDLTTIAAGPAGIVVAGQGSVAGGGAGAVFFASGDGTTWQPAVFQPAAGRFVHDIVPFGAGWLAVGAQGDDLAGAATWLSPDGATWRESTAGEAFSTPVRDVWMAAVTVGPDGRAVAVGPGPDGQATIWGSADGVAWSVVPSGAGEERYSGAYEPADVVARPDRTVMVGDYPDVGNDYPSERRWSPGVWTDPAPPDAGSVERWVTTCPGRPASLVEVLDLDPSLRPVCFGDRPLTFRAWLGGAPFDGDEQTTTPRWLTSVYAAGYAYPVEVGGPSSSIGMFLILHVDPASDLPRHLRVKGWARVTGRFDDPAAGTCDGPMTVTECQQQFVVTAVRPIRARDRPRLTGSGPSASSQRVTIGRLPGHRRAAPWTPPPRRSTFWVGRVVRLAVEAG